MNANLLLLMVFGAAAVVECVQVIIEEGGVLQGDVVKVNDERRFFSFRGIPYAKPPIGPLRLKDPVPSGSWEGIKKNFDPPECPQLSITGFLKGEFTVTGDEDCLYLHVYTPQLSSSNLLPVMFFIHGGGFLFGSPELAGGSPLPLMMKDVVLVSIQYRLGTLGFLYSGDGVIPGNMGLKDQTLALRWVQKNIRNFGGDPDRVTIFGESAGGGSVHFQMLTPKSKGLFNRAIMQSGNALCPWSFRTGDPMPIVAGVGRQVECDGVDEDGKVDSEKLLKCLQGMPAKDLVLTSSQGESYNNFPLQMVPRVDGDYLPSHPAEMLRLGQYNKVDIISGVCRDEGISMSIGVVTEPTRETLLSDFPKMAPLSIGTDQDERPFYLAQLIYYHYLGPRNISLDESDLQKLTEMFSDMFFNVPHDLTNLFHSRDVNYGKGVYMYQLNHHGPSSLLNMFVNTTLDVSKYVSHGEDLRYLFSDIYGAEDVWRDDDLFLRELILELWTNFAATGNPTPDLSMGFQWEPITTTNLQYLSLAPDVQMRPDERAEKRAFFTDLPTAVNKILFPDKFVPASTTAAKSMSEEGFCHV